jgi:hypothetical protein
MNDSAVPLVVVCISPKSLGPTHTGNTHIGSTHAIRKIELANANARIDRKRREYIIPIPISSQTQQPMNANLAEEWLTNSSM